MAGPGDKTQSHWDDLNVRIKSSIGMVALGAFGVVLGGVWFQMMVVFVTAVMVWEVWTMIESGKPTHGMLLAALLASVMSGQLIADGTLMLILFLVVPVLGAWRVKHERVFFFVAALAVQLAGYGLVHFRNDFGFSWLLWLMAVVIATDIAGYLAGRSFGGPKFWPKVSPKKTWSGTAAGWIAAGVIGVIVYATTTAAWWIIPLSMVLSFAGQMGDIAESAFKRRMGVKDSSALIPGHGGLFDRFDALIGAALFLLLVELVSGMRGILF